MEKESSRIMISLWEQKQHTIRQAAAFTFENVLLHKFLSIRTLLQEPVEILVRFAQVLGYGFVVLKSGADETVEQEAERKPKKKRL
jgi:hypothetical protein